MQPGFGRSRVRPGRVCPLPALGQATYVRAISGGIANWDSNTVLIHHAKF